MVARNFIENKKLFNSLHRSIIIEITQDCHRYTPNGSMINLCRHCYIKHSQKHADFALIDKVISFANKHTYSIGVGGGEPFLKFDLIQYILEKSKNNLINIFTSGEVFTTKQVELLSKYKNVVLSISLHGTKELHDYLASNGSYDLITKSIKLLNHYKIKWIRKTVAYSKNIDYILSDSFEKDSKALGCTKVDVCRYYPINASSNDEYKLKDNHIWLLDEKLNKLTNEGFGIYQEKKGYKCRTLPHVDVDGYVNPCPYTSGSTLNIFDCKDNDDFFSQLLILQALWKKENNGHYCKMLNKCYYG